MFLLDKERVEGGYKVDYGERGGESGCFCWPRKGMRVVIKWTMVRGMERGAFCWRWKKDECSYKADYGERGGGERTFPLAKEKDEGGYKADYDETGVDRGCFCWTRKGLRAVIKRTVVRGVEREGVSVDRGKE